MEFADGLTLAWERIGRIAVDQLSTPRRELHRALQFPAALGRSLGRSRPQSTQRSLRYSASFGALLSQESASTGVSLGLVVAEGRLVFVGPGGGVVDGLAVHGRTRGEIWRWVEKMLERTGTDGRLLDRARPEYELPEHPVDAGQPFQIAHWPACAELARHLANAHRVLVAIEAEVPSSTPVRTWPDDLATSLHTGVDPRKRFGRGEFVEYGLAVGDASYGEPYWYVAPHPPPAAGELRPLESRGFWHRGEWVGAVLPVSRLVRADEQFDRVAAFLRESASIARKVVEEPTRARKGAE